MKKLTALLLALTLSVGIFAGCGKKYEAIDIQVAGLKGPTGIGMVRLMEQNDAKKAQNNYTFELAGAPTEITGKLLSGEVDIAALPTNLAATLYAKSKGGVQIIAGNTLGVLSILEKGTQIQSIKDLKGKTIYATGQGSTTEYVLNYLLEKNGLVVGKDVFVQYKAEHSELAGLMASGQVEIAVLPQPFVTTVTTKNTNVRVALDLSTAFEEASGTKLIMGCLVARTDFVKENPEAVEKFLEEYNESVKYTKSNLDETATLCENYDIMPAAVAKKAIPNCNIVCLTGDQLSKPVQTYLQILFDFTPQAVGGSVPNEDFYYAK